MNLALVFGLTILLLVLLAASEPVYRRSRKSCHRCPGYAMDVCVPRGEEWASMCPKQCQNGTVHAQCPSGNKICLPVVADMGLEYETMCGLSPTEDDDVVVPVEVACAAEYAEACAHITAELGSPEYIECMIQHWGSSNVPGSASDSACAGLPIPSI